MRSQIWVGFDSLRVLARFIETSTQGLPHLDRDSEINDLSAWKGKKT
jgi:hypothetical protein